MKIKGDINKMIRNKIPKGVLPRTARLNYSAGDIILLVMSATRHQRKRGMGGGGHQHFLITSNATEGVP